MVGEKSVLDRVLGAVVGEMPADYAQRVLAVGFTADEHARYTELSEKSQIGTLTDPERLELDELLTANDLLTILHAKAKLSLKHSSAA